MDDLWMLIQKTYGLAGILILSPLVLAFLTFKENAKLHKNVLEAAKDVSEAQKQRVEDAKGVTSKLVELVASQTTTNREIATTLGRIEAVLTRLDRDRS